MEKTYLVGVDGGATGTLAVICDQCGQILPVYGTAGPSNYHAVGADASREGIREAVLSVLRAAEIERDQMGSLILGLAGLDHPEDGAAYQEIIASTDLDVPFTVVNDVVIAWAGATLGEPGVAVIAGTGCNAYGVNDAGESWKANGWDYILGDEGSGYWIGLQGIRAAMRAYDGRGDSTFLLDGMLDQYGLSQPIDMVRVTYSNGMGKAEIAAFAKTVSRCAREGDSVARRIMIEAAREVACAVNAVVQKLNMTEESFPVGLIGGVFESGEIFMSPFSAAIQEVAPGAQIQPARFPPAIGALIYGFYQLSELDAGVRSHIEASAQPLLEEIRQK